MNLDTITHIIFVSTEDDKYLVKGGIGTYLGIFSRTLKEKYKKINVIWISESYTSEKFIEISGNLKRIYIPQKENQKYSLAKDISYEVENEINEAFKNFGEYARIIIESPEWEGLLSELYSKIKSKQILKVTRFHTPLIVTAKLNGLVLNSEDKKQIEREKIQAISSDLLSFPTNYIKESCLAKMIKEKEFDIPFITISNCIDTKRFFPEFNTRNEAIRAFFELTSVNINPDDLNIFILGSIEKRKGTDLIVSMVEEVVKILPNAKFYFIGHYHIDGDNELTANKKLSVSDLKSSLSINAQQNIFFVGYIDHHKIPSVMQAGDLFIINYLGDNFPGVIAEIGLSKRPLLALPRGGVKEILEVDDKYAALIIDGFTSEEIINSGVKQILSFYSSVKDDFLVDMFYKKLIQNYNEDTIVELLLSSYSNSLNEKFNEFNS